MVFILAFFAAPLLGAVLALTLGRRTRGKSPGLGAARVLVLSGALGGLGAVGALFALGGLGSCASKSTPNLAILLTQVGIAGVVGFLSWRSSRALRSGESRRAQVSGYVGVLLALAGAGVFLAEEILTSTYAFLCLTF